MLLAALIASLALHQPIISDEQAHKDITSRPSRRLSAPLNFQGLSAERGPKLYAPPDGEIIRGQHGVPHIFSRSLEGAFFHAGYAVAQDRLWQMDISRRSARGQLSELTGPQGINSDRDAVRFGYTADEYAQLLSRFSPRARLILDSYAAGINAWIEQAAAEGKLPKQYTAAKPRPWEPIDSIAIGVNLIRRFGRGGAGEIRNLLLFTYLKDRMKDEAVRAIEDIAWQNDPASIPTCPNGDDPFKGVSPFPKPQRGVLEGHLKELPKVNLLELLPGIRIEEQADMTKMAAELGVPHRGGSYAMVVSPRKSAIGVPVLLSAPQMGFSVPSIVHQVGISCPEYTAVGMDVPGLPGVAVGHSPWIAWAVTSGVADTDDIFVLKLNPADPGQYQRAGKWLDFEVIETPILVRGGEAQTGRREMSVYGPVVIKSTSTGVAYVRKSTLWHAETEGLQGLLELPRIRTIEEARRLSSTLNASFNLFAATTNGDIGWFFCGRVPLRSPNVDARFPTPGDGKHDWTGILDHAKMPYVINPNQGWIANWNNKPVSWWPNFDTPIWGRIFRNELLAKAMAVSKTLTPQDLEAFARMLATKKAEPMHFLGNLLSALHHRSKPKATGTPAAPPRKERDDEIYRRALAYLQHWDGEYLDGSVAPVIYDAWFDALREEVFGSKFGNFLAPANFRLVVQPTLTWNALHARTTIDYLAGRALPDVSWAALEKALDGLERRLGPDVGKWRYAAPRIPFGELPDVLYDERGTYVQIVELWREPRGRFVAPPGVSEDPSSPFYSDQRELCANWAFFPMAWKRDDLPRR